MGVYTPNGTFYKPAIGASGAVEKGKFDDGLDVADGLIEGNKPANNKLSAFAATTSAEFAGVISDETGSGKAVFSNSPALVTPSGIVKNDVGLGNVDNTSDVNKPVSSAVQIALDFKADLISPSLVTPFLGTPASGVLSNCTGLPIAGGGTGQATRQAAIDGLTDVSGATVEHVLTKDTSTGNAIFKAAAGGGGDALKADPLSQFAATTSAELAGVISDEKGSGSLIFETELKSYIGRLVVSNWTIRTSAADNGWLSVCWSPELTLFVAVAYTGTGNRVMTSPDGINWTIRTSAANNSWYSVCWSPELTLFVAVAETGTGNRVMTSLFFK